MHNLQELKVLASAALSGFSRGTQDRTQTALGTTITGSVSNGVREGVGDVFDLYAKRTLKDICPNHVLEYPDPNVVVGRSLKMMPVEIVVRGYLAGTTSTSILSMYKKGLRQMYGFTFPDGLRDNEKLPQPIITPTSKAFHGGHDAPLTSLTDDEHKRLIEQAGLEASCDGS